MILVSQGFSKFSNALRIEVAAVVLGQGEEVGRADAVLRGAAGFFHQVDDAQRLAGPAFGGSARLQAGAILQRMDRRAIGHRQARGAIAIARRDQDEEEVA